MNLDLFKKVGLTSEEKELIIEAGTLPKAAEDRKNPEYMTHAKLNQAKVISEMYFIKHLEKSSKVMVWLTCVIAAAAVAQVLVAILR